MDFHPDMNSAPLVRRVSFSREDAESFPWGKYAELITAFLAMQTSREELVDYWRANSNMLDWAQKIKPDVYEQIRTAFAVRKQRIENG